MSLLRESLACAEKINRTIDSFADRKTGKNSRAAVVKYLEEKRFLTSHVASLETRLKKLKKPILPGLRNAALRKWSERKADLEYDLKIQRDFRDRIFEAVTPKTRAYLDRLLEEAEQFGELRIGCTPGNQPHSVAFHLPKNIVEGTVHIHTSHVIMPYGSWTNVSLTAPTKVTGEIVGAFHPEVQKLANENALVYVSGYERGFRLHEREVKALEGGEQHWERALAAISERVTRKLAEPTRKR